MIGALLGLCLEGSDADQQLQRELEALVEREPSDVFKEDRVWEWELTTTVDGQRYSFQLGVSMSDSFNNVDDARIAALLALQIAGGHLDQGAWTYDVDLSLALIGCRNMALIGLAASVDIGCYNSSEQ